MAILAASAYGADVSGKWTGTFETECDGEKQTVAAQMELKQEGTKVTGRVGRQSGDEIEIEGGTIEGSKLRFQAKPHNDDPPIVFEFTVDGDTMNGLIKGEHEGQPRQAKIEMKRGL